MRKLIIATATALLGAFATFTASAASPAATQAWVRQYMATNAAELAASTRSSTSNGVITASAGEGEDKVEVRFEEFGDAALFVTNSVTAIANGTIFVWNGNGEYINPVGTVVSTRTNLVWGAIGSYFTNGVIRFDGAFDVRPVLIQASRSFAITNGMNAAWNDAPRRWYERVTDVLAAIVVPLAYADTVPPEWYTPEEWGKLYEDNLKVQALDAKTKQWVDVKIELSTNEDGTRYVSKDAVSKAFSEVTKNVDTAIAAVGIALDGIVAVADWTMYNKASIEKLAQTVYDHAAIDLEFKSASDGSGGKVLTWSTAGKSGGQGGKPVPIHDYKIAYDTEKGEYYLDKDGKRDTESEAISATVLYDDKSIGQVKDEGKWKIQIKDWDKEKPDGDSIAEILQNETEESQNKFEVLVRQQANGTLLYKKIGYGLGLGGGANADEVSITTNNSAGAVVQGRASIYGFFGADDFDFPIKYEDKVAWIGFGYGFTLDDDADVEVNIGAGLEFDDGLEGTGAIQLPYFEDYITRGWDGSEWVPISVDTNFIYIVTNIYNEVTNTLYVTTNLYNEVTNTIYVTTNLVHILTNNITEVINLSNALDRVSAWVNADKEIEVRGFRDENKEDKEYSYYPVKVYGTNPTTGNDEWHIEWQTNDLEAVKAAMGLKTSPKRTEMNQILNLNRMDEFFETMKLVQRLYGITGIIERLNTSIKIEGAWDGKSIWTNGLAQTEIKGFADRQTRIGLYDIPVRLWTNEEAESGESPTLIWEEMPQADSSVSTDGNSYQSLEEIDIIDTVGNNHKALTLNGFQLAADGQVPVVRRNEAEELGYEQYISWEPMSGGVLAFYGTTESGPVQPVYVGSGSTTNDIYFASASDSNVKVNCTGVGGGVKITIGVYYK